MSMIKTKGIVISVTKHGEHDKLLTLFTDTLGAISVSAKGVNSRHNNLKAATRVFCYGEFLLYDKKNGYYTISEASPITDFMGLSKDLTRLETASEIVKFIKFTAVENGENKDMLKLVLNTLHMLANTDKNVLLVKCVFYLNALKFLGLPPLTGECAICGKNENLLYFSSSSGGTVCSDCAQDAGGVTGITKTVSEYMDYILNSSLSAGFGTEADEEILTLVFEVAQKFIKYYLWSPQ